MKIGIDIGHNCYPDIGASGIKQEDEVNKQVGDLIIEKLYSLGNQIVYCTPSSADNIVDSLKKRVERANDSNVDLYVSIHFNAGGGNGTEVYAMSSKGKIVADRIVKEISNLGFINRGVKDGSWLFVLRNTVAPAVLVECCFVDSRKDMSLYEPVSMAAAIVNGIVLNNFTDNTSVNKEIIKLQERLNILKITDYEDKPLVEDGILGTRTISSMNKLQRIEDIGVTQTFDAITKNTIDNIFSKPTLRMDVNYIVGIKYVQWRVGTETDGIFGPDTKAAVIKYQRDQGLIMDGVVGTLTWGKLLE